MENCSQPELLNMTFAYKTTIKNLLPQIIELYNYGWDDYAEEQLEDVLDASSLGTPLLRIAGLRLNLYMINKPTVYAQVASFGQLLSSYLDLLVTLHNVRCI